MPELMFKEGAASAGCQVLQLEPAAKRTHWAGVLVAWQRSPPPPGNLWSTRGRLQGSGDPRGRGRTCPARRFTVLPKVSHCRKRARRPEGWPPYMCPGNISLRSAAKHPRAVKLNSTPFVRQYDILSNKWGVLLCQKEYQTNDIRRSSRKLVVETMQKRTSEYLCKRCRNLELTTIKL